jgi:hypothetical protein
VFPMTKAGMKQIAVSGKMPSSQPLPKQSKVVIEGVEFENSIPIPKLLTELATTLRKKTEIKKKKLA